MARLCRRHSFVLFRRDGTGRDGTRTTRDASVKEAKKKAN
jgi:hypothetical protein